MLGTEVVVLRVLSFILPIALWPMKVTMRNNLEWARKERRRMGNCRATSKSTASTASKILRDGRYSDAAKSVAGSALSQRADSCRKRK